MRTSELAGRAGVNAETLRYYERRGLLERPPRTPSGYRDYPVSAVALLRFVKRAQELGFTLDQVEELLHLDAGGPDGCDAARALAVARKTDLENRIADLERMRDSLATLVETCDLPRADRTCPLLDALGSDTDEINSDRAEPKATLSMTGPVPIPPTTETYGAGADVETPGRRGVEMYGAGVLSSWRRQARPMEATERAVHQAILRVFARTGRPPAPADLDAITKGTGRTTQVLDALHDMDAIRLAPDGHVAVAYPFSATPTRHRVRIGGGVEVYAMCAIDALGMAAMLGTDTRIESVDVTSGKPITVTMPAPGSADETRWEPAEAVVFVGADATGGPSADCCCDYLNFFTSMPAARAWAATHPNVPGQILDRSAAESLGVELFGSLLSTA